MGDNMQTFEAIRAMLGASGKSQRGVSIELGRTHNWLNSTLGIAQDTKAGTLAAIAKVCGYELQLVNRDTGDVLTIDPTQK